MLNARITVLKAKRGGHAAGPDAGMQCELMFTSDTWQVIPTTKACGDEDEGENEGPA
jgi:hypothetical protein